MVYPVYQPLGDQGVLIHYENRIDADLSKKVRLYAEAIEQQGFSWLQDVLFGYRSLAVIYDPHQIQFAGVVPTLSKIEKTLSSIQTGPSPLYEIPTVYGGPYGPDLDRVAKVADLTTAEVIRVFASSVFTVYFLGFLCAQPYLGGLPERLQVPRLDTPRVHVPAGSVGIGGIQAGVITIEQPSGYNFIGRTFLSLYDPSIIPPTVLKAGDRIMFTQISEDQIQPSQGRRAIEGRKENGGSNESLQGP